MTCPFCDFDGPRPETHSHLVDEHADEVKTRTLGSGRRFYTLDCPMCDEGYEREIKPRLTDPTFLEEYGREIRIVAFDMFLYHLAEAHQKEGANG